MVRREPTSNTDETSVVVLPARHVHLGLVTAGLLAIGLDVTSAITFGVAFGIIEFQEVLSESCPVFLFVAGKTFHEFTDVSGTVLSDVLDLFIIILDVTLTTDLFVVFDEGFDVRVFAFELLGCAFGTRDW